MADVTIARSDVPAVLRRARWAALVIFLINGVVIASWVAHIPLIKARFGLSDGTLGNTLLVIAVGSIASLVLTSGVIARVGSRLVNIVAVLVFCALLPLILLVPSYPLLLVLLALFGITIGAMEVAANVQAVAVEERYDRPIMSTFHALFSTGGLVGAALAAALLTRGVEPLTHVLIVCATMALLAMFSLRWLLPPSVDSMSDAPAIALPTGPMMWLGLLAFFGLVGEGAMADWTAVYLRDELDTDAGFAASGFAAFSLAMAIGRFSGDALRTRFHSVALVRWSAILAAVGLGISLVLAHPVAALVGFACVGLGLSNIVPVLFSAAGRVPGVASGTGIAAVATAGYFGFLAGPPLIGYVSEASNLTIGLVVVVVFAALIALMARVIHDERR